MDQKTQIAVFGGGCFWCTEAVFERLKGVRKVRSGYAGGDVPNPTYEQVSSGQSGHAEVILIEYDPQMVSYETLLDVFFTMHDPTTLNRQGEDFGSQYRSVIFFGTPEQQTSAEAYIKKLTSDHVFNSPIVTEVVPFQKFYEAEEYHREYYNRNPSKPYCQVVINPKIAKLRQKYSHLLKS